MTTNVETKFNFKARTIRDEEGKEIGKTKKQSPVTVNLPVPTAAELIQYLSAADTERVEGEGDKQRTIVDVPKPKQLILDAVIDVIRSQAREQFDEVIDSFGNDDTKVVTPDMLDLDKLSLEYIANLEPGQRGARAIPEEDWNAFYDDYLKVMVAATGKPEKKINNQLEIFKKPTRAKGKSEILQVLVDQLDIYMANSGAIEDTADCASRLRKKFDAWSKEEDKFDVNAL